MSKPDYLDQLIDRASGKAGSDYKLAQMLGTTRQNVSNWRHGRKPCPIADVVLMAEVAGLDPDEWMRRALVEQYAGTTKGEHLYRILGKWAVATGAALATSGVSAASNGSAAMSYLIRCILC